jgi:hypothetical protein
MILGCLAATQVTSGWVAGAAAVGCTLSCIALWLVVTIRRDRVLDELVEDAGEDAHGSREGTDTEDLDGVEASGDH